MEIYPHIEVDEDSGQLFVEGVKASFLAKKYGTPLYVYSENAILEAMREYRSAVEPGDPCRPGDVIAYASKAYLTVRMAELARDQGLWLDVASGGELYIALRSGFPAEKIIFHGNNKSIEELDMAVAAGVGRVVIDNLDEISALQSVARRRKKVQGVLIRLTPGVEPHTHRSLTTGNMFSKFGIPILDDQHVTAVSLVRQALNLKFYGVHCHIGSQIFEPEPYLEACRAMVRAIKDIENRAGIPSEELDLGGGIGVSYDGAQKDPDVKSFIRSVSSSVEELCAAHGIGRPRLIFEPGRSIVAKAGVTLYRVGTVKQLPHGIKVAAVDGGMADNPRPMLYGARYRAIAVEPRRNAALEPYRIVGKHCEEGDTLIDEVLLPSLKTGDIIAVLVSGAYQYSMSSNYNALPRPAVVHVRDSRSFVVVERETYDDLIARQMFLLAPGRQLVRS